MPELVPSNEDARIYECCLLLPYPILQKEEQQLMKEIEELFEEAGGKQIAKDVWGRRGLAYEIGGYKEANVVVLHYEIVPEKIREIEENLLIMKNVLRHLIIKPPKGYEIVAYSEKYIEWQKQKEEDVQHEKLRKEEELRKKMLERQKKQSRRSAAPKKQAETEAPTKKQAGELTEQIDKLIADDELEL